MRFVHRSVLMLLDIPLSPVQSLGTCFIWLQHRKTAQHLLQPPLQSAQCRWELFWVGVHHLGMHRQWQRCWPKLEHQLFLSLQQQVK